ncbi:formylglycine-generating enzyme family protein [bacterium]|nr:formylglycine-generating enzyme family protein [bacterium]
MNVVSRCRCFSIFMGLFLALLVFSCSHKDSPTGPDDTDGMVFIEAGREFMMGSENGDEDEKPVHRVYLDDFYMDACEVSNARFCIFLNEQGNQSGGGVEWLDMESGYCRIMKQDGLYVPREGYENHPVVEVTWYGAEAYTAWAGKRLPTEAEWEYAARGGLEGEDYPWGEGINSKYANYNGRNDGTMPVENYPPNGYGLYQMAGNVQEWCADWYEDNYYRKSPYENPQGPGTGIGRVLRGGAWNHWETFLRCADRREEIPGWSGNHVGFRCAR